MFDHFSADHDIKASVRKFERMRVHNPIYAGPWPKIDAEVACGVSKERAYAAVYVHGTDLQHCSSNAVFAEFGPDPFDDGRMHCGFRASRLVAARGENTRSHVSRTDHGAVIQIPCAAHTRKREPEFVGREKQGN